MIEEKLKEKFEEKYQIWKEYKNFLEAGNKDLVAKQKEFSARVQNLETKEQVKEYFQLQAEPAKHLHDVSVLTNSLLEFYKIIESDIEFPKEVRDEMEILQSFKQYYIYKDEKLTKINDEMHSDMEEKFYANMEKILKDEK